MADLKVVPINPEADPKFTRLCNLAWATLREGLDCKLTTVVDNYVVTISATEHRYVAE